MILIPLIYVKENDILGKALIDKDQQILLQKGMAIKKSHIKRLMELGYNNLYIASRVNYEPEEFIESEARDALMQQMKKTYLKMKLACEMESARGAEDNKNYLLRLNDEKVDDIRLMHKTVEELVGDIISSKKDYLDYVSIKNHSNYTFHHAIDTGVLSTLIGRKMNMNAQQLVDIFMAAIVSELSNSCLPEDVLNKKGKLDALEYELIKQHPENGYKTAKSCPFLGHNVKLICLEHHERVDGKGYPNHLSGSKIDIKAKILAVADAYDSLTSSRTYRPPYPPHRALKIVKSEVGKSYEADVVEVLSQIIVPYPIGTVVKLNTSDLGLVVGIHRDKPERPIIITTSTTSPKKLDLSLEMELDIVGLKYDRS